MNQFTCQNPRIRPEVLNERRGLAKKVVFISGYEILELRLYNNPHTLNQYFKLCFDHERERCITILYHAIENTVTNTLVQIWNLCDSGGDRRAEHDGKVGCNTVKYTEAFLYSDWLH